MTNINETETNETNTINRRRGRKYPVDPNCFLSREAREQLAVMQLVEEEREEELESKASRTT